MSLARKLLGRSEKLLHKNTSDGKDVLYIFGRKLNPRVSQHSTRYDYDDMGKKRLYKSVIVTVFKDAVDKQPFAKQVVRLNGVEWIVEAVEGLESSMPVYELHLINKDR